MEIKLILVLLIISLVFQFGFTIFFFQLVQPMAGDPSQVNTTPREERIDLLERLWQSAEFKAADVEFRRKAFESIVVE